MKLGLLGKRLSHSFSRGYFTDKFKKEGLKGYDYANIELDNLDELRGYLIQNKIDGFNVTIPYKTAIIPYLNELDERAKMINAVNTVKVFRRSNELVLKGYNTDVDGFFETIRPFNLNEKSRALILGTGGASKAVGYVLDKMVGVKTVKYVSRFPHQNNEMSWEALQNTTLENINLIVNTTPIGMFPDIENAPDFIYEDIRLHHNVVDLIYNPLKTEFLKRCQEKGARCENGLKMLEQQAESAWKIWQNLNDDF